MQAQPNPMEQILYEVRLQHRKAELTVWFALAGALLVLAALGLTQWWSRPGSRSAR